MRPTQIKMAIIGLLTFAQSYSAFGGDHTIVAKLELTATAINRYLNTQYNGTGFPQSVPVSYGGTNYTLALTLPHIVFSPGNAKIKMVFDVNTATENIYRFEVQPSISIPSGQVTGSQIQAFFVDLPTKVNAISFLPQWVKDAVVANYDSLGLTVFPSKIIDEVNTTFLAKRSINIVEPYFSLAWAVDYEKLTLTVSTFLNSTIPYFEVALSGDNGAGDDYFYVSSNIDVTVKEVIIVDGSNALIWHGYPNVTCPKNSGIEINMGNVYLGGIGDWAIVKIRLETNETWYSRVYSNVPVNQGYYGHTSSIN